MKAFRLPGCTTTDGLTGEFILVGIRRSTADAPLALLAAEGDWGLEFAGSAVLDLPAREKDRFWQAVEDLRCDYPHLEIDRRPAEWLRPQLRVQLGEMCD
jgi:hypothetical protein